MTNSSQAGEEETLRTNVVNSLIAESVDVAAVKAQMANLQPDGRFSNVDYIDAHVSGWKAHRHLGILRTFSIAYAKPGTALHNDPALRETILQAYNHWINRTPAYTNKNWWYNEIGVPLTLSEAMLVMQHAGILPADNFPVAAALLNKALPSQEKMTAANLMWLAYSTRNEGVLRYLQPGSTPAEMAAASTLIQDSVTRISSTFQITTDDGIQADHSFHAHGPMLYDGGYGLAWITNAGRVAMQSAGTRYAVSDDASRIMIDYLLDGAQWVDRGDGIDLLASGREVSRSGLTRKALGHHNPAVQGVALGKGYRVQELQKLIQRLELARKTSTADSENVAIGNRQFRRSDYLVHQRPQGMFSVKTMSARTATPESINGENLLGTHLYAGVNLIQRTGNEYDQIAAVWDWHRLPGTTTARGGQPLLPPTTAQGKRGKTAFAGGASDGMNGLMGYRLNHLQVTALKSWMMFENAQVALGSDISAPTIPSAHRVGTTINQTLLSGDVTYAVAGNATAILTAGQTISPRGLRWIHHDSVGYFFFDPTNNVTVSLAMQEGNWFRINTSQPDKKVELPVFSLDLDHGPTPAGASYAYGIVTGITAAEMETYVASKPFTVLRNDAAVQAARDNVRDSVEITFFTPATIKADRWTISQITEEQGSSVLFTTQGDLLTMSVASPSHWEGELSYRVNARLVGENATWDHTLGQTTVRFPLPRGANAGGTTTQRFTLGGGGNAEPAK